LHFQFSFFVFFFSASLSSRLLERFHVFSVPTSRITAHGCNSTLIARRFHRAVSLGDLVQILELFKSPDELPPFWAGEMDSD
jgi:hypothetical protein